jgi:DNA-binding MarR family transcriptional regulator
MPEPGGLPELDPIVHGQLRLAVLSLLAGVEEGDFKWLRERTGSTDGNLGANLTKLEEAKYIGVTKKFVAKKPNSVYRLTPAGRKALASYIKALRHLLGESL